MLARILTDAGLHPNPLVALPILARLPQSILTVLFRATLAPKAPLKNRTENYRYASVSQMAHPGHRQRLWSVLPASPAIKSNNLMNPERHPPHRIELTGKEPEGKIRR